MSMKLGIAEAVAAAEKSAVWYGGAADDALNFAYLCNQKGANTAIAVFPLAVTMDSQELAEVTRRMRYFGRAGRA